MASSVQGPRHMDRGASYSTSYLGWPGNSPKISPTNGYLPTKEVSARCLGEGRDGPQLGPAIYTISAPVVFPRGRSAEPFTISTGGETHYRPAAGHIRRPAQARRQACQISRVGRIYLASTALDCVDPGTTCSTSVTAPFAMARAGWEKIRITSLRGRFVLPLDGKQQLSLLQEQRDCRSPVRRRVLSPRIFIGHQESRLTTRAYLMQCHRAACLILVPPTLHSTSGHRFGGARLAPWRPSWRHRISIYHSISWRVRTWLAAATHF